MMHVSYNAPPELKRFQQLALPVGAVLFAVLVIGFFLDRGQFFRSYLFAFSFWAGISVGSLALLMLQHLTGGGWGFVIRRTLEAATRTLPLMLLLFLPIVAGAHWLYPWTHAEEIAKNPELHQDEIKELSTEVETLQSLFENYNLGMNVFRRAQGGRAGLRE